jgi:hypothetical protein
VEKEMGVYWIDWIKLSHRGLARKVSHNKGLGGKKFCLTIVGPTGGKLR